MAGVSWELRFFRFVLTLGFLYFLTMTVVKLQGGESAWGFAFGTVAAAIAVGYLWKDDLAAMDKAREERKAADITRSNQHQGQIVFPTAPNQLPAPGQVTPPTGPSSPIQRGN